MCATPCGLRMPCLSERLTAKCSSDAMWSMTTIELYALGVPFFVPTIEIAASTHRDRDHFAMGNDRHITAGPDGQFHGADGCKSLRNVSLPPKDPRVEHPFSPEDESVPARRYWLQFANYWLRPHVTTFSSFSDLVAKLQVADFGAINRGMMEHNVERHKRQTHSWERIFKQIRRGGQYREIPADYTRGMQALWGESSVAGQLATGVSTTG